MSLKDAFNRANPNHLADEFRTAKLGDVLRSLSVHLYKQAPSAPVPLDQIASTHTLKLPNDAKACRIHRAVAVAGSGTPAELVIDTPPMTSATAAGHINISAAGDLTFASADAWTRVDVDYLPAVMDTVTLTLPVVTSDIALPTSVTAIGAVMLLRAVLTVGTVTGEGKVIAPGSRSSTTLQCNLNLAKDTVQFVSADAVTQATITLGLVPGTNLDTLLKASEGVLT